MAISDSARDKYIYQVYIIHGNAGVPPQSMDLSPSREGTHTEYTHAHLFFIVSPDKRDTITSSISSFNSTTTAFTHTAHFSFTHHCLLVEINAQRSTLNAHSRQTARARPPPPVLTTMATTTTGVCVFANK